MRGPIAVWDKPFWDLWNRAIGMSSALQFWEGHFSSLLHTGGSPSFQEWTRATEVRAINIVGAENAVYEEGTTVIAGVSAVRSPRHLLALLKQPS